MGAAVPGSRIADWLSFIGFCITTSGANPENRLFELHSRVPSHAAVPTSPVPNILVMQA
jgi:hypothetical protein